MGYEVNVRRHKGARKKLKVESEIRGEDSVGLVYEIVVDKTSYNRIITNKLSLTV